MQNKKQRTLLFALVFLLLVADGAVFADPVGGAIPANLNYGGVINTHDMMILRDKQRLLEEERDFKNYQERKKGKKEKVIENAPEIDQTETEKIYDAETSKKMEEGKALYQKKKSERRFFFFKKKKQNSEIEVSDTKENAASAESEVTKTEEETVVTAGVEKTDIEDGKIYVRAVAVSNSKILTDEEIQRITDMVIGKQVTIDDLNRMIIEFNYVYATKGYVTAKAFLPPQEIKEGIVKVKLVEARVGQISIENNRWTSDSYIEKRISAREGEIFQIVELEEDIVKFNKYNDGIKLKANLKKGEALETTDIVLSADEKFPFHVRGLMDNAGRKTIGELRGGLMLSADSLFKQRDRFAMGSYVSSHSVTPFADYNIPVNKYDGRVGFLFSSSMAEIGEGPYKIFDIESRSFNYSLYYTHPLIRKPTFELTSYSAVNYKSATTLFGGYEINNDKITSFETSLSARLDTKYGIWYLNQGVYQAFPIFDDASRYFKYTGSIIRLHDFGHGIVGQLRGMYQYSPKDVMPYIDQFQAGGIASVRGYSEGLLIGRSGYVISGELLFPILPSKITVKKKDTKEKKVIPFLGKYVKGIVFVDHAGVFPFKGKGPGAQTYDQSDYMVSTGLGLRISLPGDITARLYWGFPLMHNPHETYYRNPRFSFELSFAPDFDKLLKFRKTLKNKEKQETQENL